MKCKKNYLYLTIIFFVTCIVLSSLFLNDRYQGHDTVFHVSNIIRLSKTISLDNIFGNDILRYNVDNFSYGLFGYGIGLFYPRMPHLIASYLYLLLDDIYLSMNIIYFVTTLLSGVFTYFLANKIYNSKNIALISSLIYITFPYHICEIYIRDAFAENFIFMVLPMIFLGLYNLRDGNYKNFYILFILGYIIGMNSHLVSLMFYTFFVGIFILYYRKDFFKKDKFLSLLKSAFVVTIVVLPSLVTILEHKSLGIYRVFTPTFAWVDDIFILNIKELFIQEAVYDDIMPYLNISSIILFCLTTLSVLFYKKDSNKSDKKMFLLFIYILVNLLCSNIIWDNMPSLFLSIQFPWRLMIFMALLIALYVPGIFNSKIFKNKIIYKLCLVLVIFFVIYEGYGNIKYHTDVVAIPEETLNSTLSLGYSREYFPMLDYAYQYGSNYFPEKEYEFLKKENVIIEIINDELPNMEFRVSNILDDTAIEIPRTFYLGYRLVSPSNENIKLEVSGNGLLKAVINEDGIYKLSYDKTITVKITQLIRLMVVFLIGVVLAVKKWKRKKLQY